MKKILTLVLLLLSATISFSQNKYDIKSINIYDGNGFVSCGGTFAIDTYNNNEYITVYDVNNKPLITVFIESYLENKSDELVIKGITDNSHKLTIYIHMYSEYIQVDFIDNDGSRITINTDNQKK